MNTIENFEKIISLARKNGFSSAFFESAKEHLDAAGNLLKTNPTQTALFALLLEHFGEDSVSLKDLAKTLKCGKMQLIKYMDDFEYLRRKKLIRPEGSARFLRNNSGFPEYYVPMDVVNAVRNGVEYKSDAYENLNPEEFFECADGLIASAKQDEICTETFVEEIKDLLGRNPQLCFVKKYAEYDLKEGSGIIMLVFCCALLNHDKDVLEVDHFINFLSEIIGRGETRKIKGRFKSREHKLFETGLIEYDCNNNMADTKYLRLTEKAKNEFLADVDLKEKTKRKGDNYILAENIKMKSLYYSDKVKSRINELSTLLKEDNFSGIQKRLAENGMRTGFACIFSGPPGTGKTETVYQIARETGRDIMMVDISDTKSMWFGESEKRIKAVFIKYRGALKSPGPAPILLFNEADAVLGKRQELGESRSGPGQTENAIQNIILQEMEDLNGILIATTNMVTNFDKAFERRFLYKIEFENPDTQAKKLMWQSHIPSLCGSDAEELDNKYEFSGGQIENIARKNTVSYILKGTDADFSSLETLCNEELKKKAPKRIGFCA